MKDLINALLKYLVAVVLFMGYSANANAFACVTASGAWIPIGGGSANVYVSLAPSIGVGQNLVVDLSRQISCRNDYPDTIIDYVSLKEGSAYGGVLASFTGSLSYSGSIYPFPTTSETRNISYRSNVLTPWPAVLYLTPMSSAGGIAITSGSLIAVLRMHQTNNEGDSFLYTWRIFANNDVVIPTGGCDVSARDVTVNLPNYPGTGQVPLTVRCAQNQNLSYFLTGTTEDSASTIFTNTASSSQAQGIGIQLSNSGGVIATNRTVSLGIVGPSPVSLGLTASYARTRGQVVAGNVTSVVGVTFVYQ
ncbi:minor fimbrial subunit [Serratia fonticola]|jgi:minor fimbrial subunit|uniref:Minor fimbrial subunit n=1 Tax=Serratia fonticola TaxID=47917 RepID=A0A559T1V2_SERFO|nr:fimbrial protein [Serratia fonticola]TQI78925.1 minor fimbrial subunit [Serratia fonticola]TQI99052.1 minor fimbrial subunit [Serratia fonticola]TVZ68577.1 minor fimbrial subunit [Serratia fonticola]